MRGEACGREASSSSLGAARGGDASGPAPRLARDPPRLPSEGPAAATGRSTTPRGPPGSKAPAIPDQHPQVRAEGSHKEGQSGEATGQGGYGHPEDDPYGAATGDPGEQTEVLGTHAHGMIPSVQALGTVQAVDSAQTLGTGRSDSPGRLPGTSAPAAAPSLLQMPTPDSP